MLYSAEGYSPTEAVVVHVEPPAQMRRPTSFRRLVEGRAVASELIRLAVPEAPEGQRAPLRRLRVPVPREEAVQLGVFRYSTSMECSM